MSLAEKEKAIEITANDAPKEDIINIPHCKYIVVGILGEGCYGKVVKCWNRATRELVALKFLKKGRERGIKSELKMLEAIRQLDPDVFNFIRFVEFFELGSRQCMVFELLDLSMHDLFKQKGTFSLNQIRPVAKQLLIALTGLSKVGVLHTDIKPDNIMLVSNEKQPFKVKLIDFGLAKRCDQVKKGQSMQPVGYRAPEVTLGLVLCEALDMWSLGCCFIVWYLGASLFCGASQFDNLTKIVHFLGVPENELLKQALYTKRYFVWKGAKWRLKTVQEYKDISGSKPEMYQSHLTGFKDVEDLFRIYKRRQPDPEFNDRMALFDLIRRIFTFDPNKRIISTDALAHTFITMEHLPGGTRYTKEAHEFMRVADSDYLPWLRESLQTPLNNKPAVVRCQGKSPGERVIDSPCRSTNKANQEMDERRGTSKDHKNKATCQLNLATRNPSESSVEGAEAALGRSFSSSETTNSDVDQVKLENAQEVQKELSSAWTDMAEGVDQLYQKVSVTGADRQMSRLSKEKRCPRTPFIRTPKMLKCLPVESRGCTKSKPSTNPPTSSTVKIISPSKPSTSKTLH